MMNETGSFDIKDWSKRQKEFHDTMSITRTRMFIHEDEKKHIKKKRKMLILRLLLILFIAAFVFADFKIAGHKSVYNYQDVLKELSCEDPAYQNISDYLRYLTQRVSSHGYAGLKGKWLDEIPSFFDNSAKEKFQKLGQRSFVIENIKADKDNVFHVRCHPLESFSDSVEIDVIKVKVEDNFIFRLLRVY